MMRRTMWSEFAVRQCALDELNRLNIEFVSLRELIGTGGPLGRAVVVIIGAIAEMERRLIVERVRAGMRRAKLEGRHIGLKPLELDRPLLSSKIVPHLASTLRTEASLFGPHCANYR